MTNSEKDPIFIESILKVNASEDIDMTKELLATNPTNLSIQDLLSAQNEKKSD